mmetsp:Transcript_43652/g.102985  ORF Transcript_43652/g.102985 Transcript_43652/m.102985 type:complete len:452 (+) Transcript_43652:94-1449(+)|eukprot:CAMPEP_0178413762 /NCGR_PEP_ID=MMETSP0689_2-20121128/22693_1 /TAXON_ID=160604 /ORGANISM="Amphidinium massartii, Strain CS-259" /LENGTH=451 /DNA_ID=CAMNT_0020035041 /DNA_START=29 /DNA_END=1384 /DNA_ORIENTATION=-
METSAKRWQRRLQDSSPQDDAASQQSIAKKRMLDIQMQIEYYLSDKNLARDEFFRNRLAVTGGSISDADLLGCKRLQKLGVEREEIAEAVSASKELELHDVQRDEDGKIVGLSVRRVVPYHLATSTVDAAPASSGSAAAAVAHSSSGGTQRAPQYDSCTPCGYHMAGYCYYGHGCKLQHSGKYAAAVREQWLQPCSEPLQDALRAEAIETLGKEAVLSSRLFPRAFARFLTLANGGGRGGRSAAELAPQKLRHIFILDLEGKDEITEFPVIAMDLQSGHETGRFQRYVRPKRLFEGQRINPESPAIEFPAVLEEFDLWLRGTVGYGLDAVGGEDAAGGSCFLTCGDWDCKHVHTQCRIAGIETPPAFAQWVNIKRTYSEHYCRDFRGMKSMLAQLKLLDNHGNVTTGFHHLGMHDVENIGRCLLHLLQQGVTICPNGSMRKPGGTPATRRY